MSNSRKSSRDSCSYLRKAPPASEPTVAAKKWFWKIPPVPTRLPVSRGGLLGSVNLSLWEVRSQLCATLQDACGRESNDPSGGRATAEYVDARASRDDEAHSVAIAVEEGLQQVFPLGVFV